MTIWRRLKARPGRLFKQDGDGTRGYYQRAGVLKTSLQVEKLKPAAFVIWDKSQAEVPNVGKDKIYNIAKSSCYGQR